MQNSTPDRFAVVRTIVRRSDYGWRESLWLASGAHIYGHGRTKWDAHDSALRQAFAYQKGRQDMAAKYGVQA